MKIEQMGIKKQVLYLVLSCSIITLLVAGGISLYGMMHIKSNAINIGVEIGNVAAENSSKALKEVSIASLQGLVNERAKQVDNIFNDFVWDVNTFSIEMTTILQNPQNYSPRYVSPPSIYDSGKIIPQIQFRSDVNPASLQYEVGLTANLQDFQMRIMDGNPSIGSTYVSSESGFNITVDSISETRVDSNNNPLPNDYRTRPWYRKVMEEKKLVFTDAFSDSQGRGLAIACAAPYYNLNGEIAGVVGEGRTLENVSQIVNKTKIGETGFGFIINQKGQILFSQKTEGTLSIAHDNNLNNSPSLLDNPDSKIMDIAKKMVAGETGLDLINIDGTSYYLAYTPLENTNWSFGVLMEESEITMSANLNNSLIAESTNQFVDVLNSSIKMMILAMLAAFVIIIVLVPFAGRSLAEKFTKPIQLLTDGVREIANGNLDKKLDIQTGNEIEHLATCFNAMTDELKTYMNNLTKITAEKERIATELDVAKNIQTSMLPNLFPAFPDRKEFDIYASMNAAKEVGGDFYDFYLLDKDHLVVTIADVSGKGIPAALFMMISKTILKNFSMSIPNPNNFSWVMKLSNNQLCQNNEAMMFVTVFMGVYNIKTGEFIFVNAGHNPPLVYHKKTDSYEYLDVNKNFVLGGMEDIDFTQQSIKLESGDIFFMYTDGVTEALNNAEELYGEQRLKDCLNRSDKNLAVKDLLTLVREDVNAHVNDATQSDDITMLAFKIN